MKSVVGSGRTITAFPLSHVAPVHFLCAMKVSFFEGL
jgi:hypothetical protein